MTCPAVCVFDIVSFLASLTAMVVLLKGWSRPLPRDIKLLITGLIVLTLFHNFSNALEWSGITKALDVSEDYVEILIPVWWGITFYALFQEIVSRDLQQSEKKYRDLYDNAPDMYVSVDARTAVILDCNQTLVDALGYAKEEIIGRSIFDMYTFNSAEYAKENILPKFMKTGTIKGVVLQLQRKDGSKIDVSLNVSAVYDENDDIIYSRSSWRDITEQKKLEGKLHQAQKMESLGTLAGGIAHDFNNLLMGIQGCTSLILMDFDSSHPHFEYLKGIEDYVKSAAGLTKQLLGFAREGKYEAKTTDLNNLIKKQNKMFRRTSKEINIREQYAENLWAANVDQGQIEQVLLNLYVNAWHAMPGGGDLTIQTENVLIDENFIRHFEVEPGKYIKISITDNGVGMDESTRKRIFEPFFTTKEMGRGSGLGLASAYGIIKNHRGFIDVYSEKGEGTTFKVYLPASEKEPDNKSQLHEEWIPGTGSILLVDDEDMIIEVSREIIEKLGYEIRIAKSGREAIESYKKNQDQIDLVILDMIMPDMSGGETYDKLKEIHPEIKVLLSSGYSINGRASEILERGCNSFIQKPFNIKELSMKIRKILDES